MWIRAISLFFREWKMQFDINILCGCVGDGMCDQQKRASNMNEWNVVCLLWHFGIDAKIRFSFLVDNISSRRWDFASAFFAMVLYARPWHCHWSKWKQRSISLLCLCFVHFYHCFALQRFLCRKISKKDFCISFLTYVVRLHSYIAVDKLLVASFPRARARPRTETAPFSHKSAIATLHCLWQTFFFSPFLLFRCVGIV